jgi:hypothetical protein
MKFFGFLAIKSYEKKTFFTNLQFTLKFVRKLRPKLFHQIDPSQEKSGFLAAAKKLEWPDLHWN